MKIIKGWKKIRNNGSYINEHSEQTLLVSKKQFSANYHVMLYFGRHEDGKLVSPEFATESKAAAFAIDLMTKHPKGMKLIA
jgi:hypothetical protein